MSELHTLVLESTLPEYIELIIIDCLNIPAIGQVYYLTPSGTESATIQFNGHTYEPFPMQIAGVAQTSAEAPARPTLSLANVNNLFGSLAKEYNDIINAKVTYIRTFSEFLGISGTISAPPIKYVIRKKSAQDRNVISFELGSPMDYERGQLPKRRILRRDFPGTTHSSFIR